ncbi:MAG: HNH endonuclease, partial [Chloracidobacterium sp.]|nr:HNH endonuclease [Chloracidobacterium sp.]
VREKLLGRYLQPSEIVHHLDGDKQKNHPSNLRVYESNSAHFLEEHSERPRDSKTGRFLPKQGKRRC